MQQCWGGHLESEQGRKNRPELNRRALCEFLITRSGLGNGRRCLHTGTMGEHLLWYPLLATRNRLVRMRCESVTNCRMGAARTRTGSSEREIDSDTGEVRMVERTMDCLLHNRLTNYLGRGHQFIRTGRQESNARAGAHSVCHGATSSW